MIVALDLDHESATIAWEKDHSKLYTMPLAQSHAPFLPELYIISEPKFATELLLSTYSDTSHWWESDTVPRSE